MHQGEARIAAEQEDGKRSPGWYTIPAACFSAAAHSPGPAGNLKEKFVSYLQAREKRDGTPGAWSGRSPDRQSCIRGMNRWFTSSGPARDAGVSGVNAHCSGTNPHGRTLSQQ